MYHLLWQSCDCGASATTVKLAHGVATTPLQAASAAASLINGGNLISPTFPPRSPEQAATLSRNVTKQSMSAGMSPTFLPRSRAEATATSALAGEVVNDSQDPKATTIRESVADEIEAPALIGTRRQCQRPSRSQGTLATATFAHGQLLFPIETPELLQVHDDPLALTPALTRAVRSSPGRLSVTLRRMPKGRKP